MEIVIANSTGKAHRTYLGGREFLVAPLTLIVPGVLAGSQGPLYYPSDEVGKNPQIWDNIPLVLHHPYVDGEPVSAKSPSILGRSGMGYSADTVFNDKLQSNGYFDVELTKRVSYDVWQRLNTGVPVELSTGLHLEQVPEESVFNGRPYKARVKNFVPDHIAILPDSQGACSIKDGCGVLVNVKKKEGDKELSSSAYAYVPDPQLPSTWKLRIDDAAHVAAAAAALGKGGFRGQKVKIPSGSMGAVKAKVRAAWKKFFPKKSVDEMPEGIRNEAGDLAANQPSHDQLRSQLCELIEQKYSTPMNPGDFMSIGSMSTYHPYVVDVFDKFVVFSMNGKLYRLKYMTDLRTDQVTLSGGDPTEVTKKTTYKPVSNEGQLEPEVDMAKLNETQRKETIDFLVTNCDCWKGPDDRDLLEQFTDDKLTSLRSGVEKSKQQEAVANAARKGFTDTGGNSYTWNEQKGEWEMKPKPAQTVNSDTTRLTPEEQEDLRFAREERNRQKTDMVNRLAANIQDAGVKAANIAVFNAMSLDQLRTLVSAIPAQAPAPTNQQRPYYGGQSVPAVNQPNVVNDEDDMLLPTYMQPMAHEVREEYKRERDRRRN